MNGMDQMRPLAQQPLALAQGFADQIEFSMFEVAQAAVDDARGAASHTRSEVILLNQQSALTGAGTLTCDGNAIDSPADDYNVEVLAVERSSGFNR